MGNNLAQVLADGEVQPGELAIAGFASNRDVFFYDQPMKLGQTPSVQSNVRIAAFQPGRIEKIFQLGSGESTHLGIAKLEGRKLISHIKRAEVSAPRRGPLKLMRQCRSHLPQIRSGLAGQMRGAAWQAERPQGIVDGKIQPKCLFSICVALGEQVH